MMTLKLPREQKETMIAAVQAYFETERGESIGSIAAEGFVDFMIGAVGPHIYNQAVQDARRTVNERLASVEDDLYALEKPLPRLGR
ncbi:DUF2164 domain-containing protein [Paenibacillus sp.]|uniref:DUF2164 domain-containing protein n=1 Tax=Paenibacillus sp. TaxID=58172 RepID=UPI002810C1B1|nr:DUF2164 domain-containing protein [Paenibacillus sp.]